TSTSNSSSRGSHRSSCSMVNGPERSCTTATVIFMTMRPDLFGCVHSLRNTGDRFSEIFRGLRTRHSEFTVEDEAGHAFDARFLGGKRFTFDFGNVFLAGQVLFNPLGIQADRCDGLRQYFAVRQVGAFRKIEIHQLLLHLRRLADATGPTDQPVRIERLGLPAHFVAVVGEAVGRRSRWYSV